MISLIKLRETERSYKYFDSDVFGILELSQSISQLSTLLANIQLVMKFGI